ncbi:MAG: TatD family nuclease-associated radical SAM protein [Lachnospiraceae bacterium]
MKKTMTILYEAYNNLYINITNKCPCNCTFCLRQTRDSIEHSNSLWLEREPNYDEIIMEFHKYDLSKYKDIVFCGFGEPTERLELILDVAHYLKQTYTNRIRINTNGLCNLIHGKSIAYTFEGLIDCVSISLNTPNEDRYHELVQSKFGKQSFKEMLLFAEEVTKYVPKVYLTTVATTLTKEEEMECKKICDAIGATYRIRPWED